MSGLPFFMQTDFYLQHSLLFTTLAEKKQSPVYLFNVNYIHHAEYITNNNTVLWSWVISHWYGWQLRLSGMLEAGKVHVVKYWGGGDDFFGETMFSSALPSNSPVLDPWKAFLSWLGTSCVASKLQINEHAVTCVLCSARRRAPKTLGTVKHN